MATVVDTPPSNGNTPASKINLSASTAGIFHIPNITPEAAKKASDLLQENHIRNHVFFNQSGFHNHIAHHLLTVYALGATPSQLQTNFANNQSYQRPLKPVNASVVDQMRSSRDKFASFFGKEKYYRDYEEFFEHEIERKGVKGTLDEWVFKGDEVAEGMLTRLFAGFYHPLIHFGFGLEFHQPAILAEALAQTAIHDNWVAPYLLGCETPSTSSSSTNTTVPSLISLLDSARSNPTIRSSPHRNDANKTRDGVIARAAAPLTALARQWTVLPTRDDIAYKTAEMIQTSFYFTAAALHPTKIPKFDFFYMHCTNASVFFSSFVDDAAHSDERTGVFGDEPGRKRLARMLEMKARTDLAMYISRNSPALDIARIKSYAPKHDSDWAGVFARACQLDDDGHASKFVRATANAERVCAVYEDRARSEGREWPITKKDGMWLKIAHMIVDSVEVEAGGPRWVRGAGWEEEWKEVPDWEGAKL